MTGRERMRAVLRGEPTDRLPWTALVDGPTLGALAAPMAGMDALGFYRHLGCDVFQLGGFGVTPLPATHAEWGPRIHVECRAEGGATVEERHLPEGTLRAVSRGAHPVEYLVSSEEDLAVYRAMWERASYVPPAPAEAEAAWNELLGAVGESGIVTSWWGPSTIPRLLENDMGTENFYYLFHDCEEEMRALIGTMHAKELDAFRHLAAEPTEVVTLVENTSTFYISPQIYEEFNGPHQKDFVDIVHAAGKTAILHMCGHVHALLPLIRQTGTDGIHALTPPPTGDTPWEAALDGIGEDLVIISALDPTIFLQAPLEEVGPALDRLITPRLREANFVLGVMADGLPVPYERFDAVRRWVEANG